MGTLFSYPDKNYRGLKATYNQTKYWYLKCLQVDYHLNRITKNVEILRGYLMEHSSLNNPHW